MGLSRRSIGIRNTVMRNYPKQFGVFSFEQKLAEGEKYVIHLAKLLVNEMLGFHFETVSRFFRSITVEFEIEKDQFHFRSLKYFCPKNPTKTPPENSINLRANFS